MTRLPFQFWTEGPIHWARFVSDSEPPVRHHWSGLHDADALDELAGANWHRLAINNNNREEVAVYLRIAWSLLQDREVLGNAFYWSGHAAQELAQRGTVVRWQFETDSQGPPGHLAIRGFTPARSSVQIQPRPTDEQRWMRDKSLLFRVSNFGDCVTLLRSVLGDAAGEISLFGTTEAGAYRLPNQLNADAGPAIEDLLTESDLFVSLGLGVDLGYNDHILVASRTTLRPILEPILDSAERAIGEYEARVNDFLSPHAALTLMERLAGIVPSPAS